MCAIAGIYSAAGRPVDLRMLEAMIRVQAHRGPDGEGYVLLDPSAREKPLAVSGPGTPTAGARHALALAHRRLAIVAVSPLGHQPRAIEDECCWITYNGEHYNYVEVGIELEANEPRFRSALDT